VVRLVLAVLVAMSVVPALAAPITLDFDTYDRAGTQPVPSQIPDLPGDAFSDYGVTLSVDPANASSTLGLYNTECNGNGATEYSVECTGGDEDLATSLTAFGTIPQGYVLIINGGGSTLNDDRFGGSITFAFDAEGGVLFSFTDLLDIDEVDPVNTTDILFSFDFVDDRARRTVSVAEIVAANSANSQRLSSVVGNNSLYGFTFFDVEGANGNGEFEGVSAFTITYDGISGAVGAITFEPPQAVVPVPTGLPMLAGALGLLVYLRFRSAA